MFVRSAKAEGIGDGKKHRGKDWDLKNKWENSTKIYFFKKGKKEIVSSLTKSNSNIVFVNNRDNICFLQQMLRKYITAFA